VADTVTGDALQALQAQVHQRLLDCVRLLEAGVRITDPATTHVEAGVEIGRGTEIRPNTTIGGRSVIGARSIIGPNTVVTDSRIERGPVQPPATRQPSGDRSTHRQLR
jgi:bifunctional UDP-N-acetylglucosamine pyrophosphorylase/glucosamine-1-phosphate N-acetyltransferase